MSCGVEKRKEALFLSPEASRRHHFQATLSSHVIAKIQSQKGNEAAGKDGEIDEANSGAKSVREGKSKEEGRRRRKSEAVGSASEKSHAMQGPENIASEKDWR